MQHIIFLKHSEPVPALLEKPKGLPVPDLGHKIFYIVHFNTSTFLSIPNFTTYLNTGLSLSLLAPLGTTFRVDSNLMNNQATDMYFIPA